MPFTAAHPMAVLPLVRWRRGLDATCLVIGSMAPDVEYFIRGRPFQTISHSLLGMVTWSLPVTLILAAVLHAIVKWPMLAIAPVAVARRAVAAVGAPWPARWSAAALASCAVSAVLGGASHLAWDNITHTYGWLPTHVRALWGRVQLPVVGSIPVVSLLQHGSTVIGLTVLTVVVVRALRRETPQPLPEPAELPRLAARGCLVLCIAVGLAAMYVRLAMLHESYLGSVVVAAIDGVGTGVIVASGLLWRLGRRLRSSVRVTAHSRIVAAN
jgi:hypothetical protein